MSAALRVGSLFTGYGGLDMAVRQVLGGKLTWVSDNHPSAVKLLAHHHPDVPNLGDITAIDWHQVEPVDVLAAGFPCQDISNAGQRAGIGGKRSGLWSHVADAIRVLRPRLVVLENVSAIVVRGLDRVLADLAALGFDAEWTTLRASDVDAPHRRERWFLTAWPVGHSALLGRNAAPDPERGGERPRSTGGPGVAAAHPARDGHGHSGAPSVGGVPASAVAGGERAPVAHFDGAGLEGGEPARGHELPARSTAADTHARRLGEGQRHVHAGEPDADRRRAAADPDGDGQQQREGDQPDLAGRVGDGGPLDWGNYGPAVHRWESVLGRLAPAPTVLSDRYLKMLRLRLDRRSLSVTVTVSGDRDIQEDVLELNDDYLGWNCTRRDEWNSGLHKAVKRFGKEQEAADAETEASA